MSPCASHDLRIQISEVVATNTLIVANLDRDTFLHENIAKLQDLLELHGKIYKFVPIKSLNRILAIFYQPNDAAKAKTYCDRLEFLTKNIRIYYGQHTPIYDEIDNSRHLCVPEIEKNWLISPPGSPPFGWIPIKEDRPNSNTLSHDLAHALAHVSLDSEIQEFSLDNTNQDRTILTVVPCDSDSHQNDVNVPLILIQDWDDSDTKETERNLQKTKAQLCPLMQRPSTPTPRPPLLFS
ncbi:3505_t:CDS:2 [Funneliformis geosporum]|uniref:12258_t:CDS:1 n=1 Tax=Funneliformis geosporum TaxID=1117311 RepID=A0A9W4SBS5_9GLOM|nr:12258_t:CDS:2 [Funneliformis geosporum]CAI2163786.1 3505_t:CDS:2 [Funneliformis geosporum]